MAGTFEEFAKAVELCCCLISEIQSDMYKEGMIIFSLTVLFKVYNNNNNNNLISI